MDWPGDVPIDELIFVPRTGSATPPYGLHPLVTTSKRGAPQGTVQIAASL